MQADLFLSLIGVVTAAKKVVDNLPNDNPHVGELVKEMDSFVIDHKEKARALLRCLVLVDER